MFHGYVFPYQLISCRPVILKQFGLLAAAVTVGETEGAMDSASVLVFTSSFDFRRECILKNFDLIKFKMAFFGPLFTFTWPLFGRPC